MKTIGKLAKAAKGLTKETGKLLKSHGKCVYIAIVLVAAIIYLAYGLSQTFDVTFFKALYVIFGVIAGVAVFVDIVLTIILSMSSSYKF